MTNEPDLTLERAYRYQTGCAAMGCIVLMCGGLGAGGFSLLSFGCQQVQDGRVVVGAAAGGIGFLGIPMLLVAVIAFVAAIRDTLIPSYLRLTPTALRLPDNLRGPVVKPEEGEGTESYSQPEEIPFTAIRWVRREAGMSTTDYRLMIIHDLGPTTVEIKQSMMRPREFEELETILRAAVPNAFTAAPPPNQPSQ